jgi:carbon storage regulator
MLVLSRQAGEQLMIAGEIEVTVVEIRADRVKLGISAPPDVPVHREEVFRRISAEQSPRGRRPSLEESRFHSEFA